MKLPILKCERCGHTWVPRSNNRPAKCPKCTSPYWNKPRQRFWGAAKAAMGLLLVFLATGCHKKNDDGSPSGVGSTLPGNCSWVMAAYQGAIVNSHPASGDDRQSIATNADVINHPYDQVVVDICMGSADCRNQRPTQDCAATSFTAPCYRAISDPHIVLGVNTVELVNAAQAGFQSYSIDTTVCR